MKKRNLSQKVAKEIKRKTVQAVRRRNGWVPVKGTTCYTDKY